MITDRVVALVGRPNVGKSRLFNRLVKKRIAIVHDQPGVTRDVLSEEVDDDFTLLDTGGLGLFGSDTGANIIQATEDQVDFAVQTAKLILFVVDAKEGPTPVDEMVAEKLRRSGRPVELVVNKVDNDRDEEILVDFHRLGFSEPMAVSAEHGRGEGELRERIAERLGPRPPEDKIKDPDAAARIRICFLGRPNVGKSSLGNRLLKSDRLIVTDTPGTTRDAIALDLDYEAEGGAVWPFRLVDMAGVRPRSKVSSSVEYFATVRAQNAIEQSDVVFLVLDAKDGVTRQEKVLAGSILSTYRAFVILVNKWDLALEAFENDEVEGYENEREFREAFAKAARKELFFNPDSPVIFVSALKGFEIDRMLKAARKLYYNVHRKLPTGRLNRLLIQLADKRPPAKKQMTRFRIYYAVQTGNNPIKIRLFCNDPKKLDDPYKRYLEAGVSKEFSLEGCPIKFEMVGKEKRFAK
ncbi:MAG: ribosome biogenesis GTPase Der [Opitutales bacterium]